MAYGKVPPFNPRWSRLITLLILLTMLSCNIPVQTRFWGVTPAVTASAPQPPNSPTPAAPSPERTVTATAAAATAPAWTPTPDERVFFDPAPCAFSVPAGTSPECGYLVVPENRSRPGSRMIRLHVALFHSHAATPARDPVIHLAGGPGSSSLELARYLFSYGIGAVLEERDLVLFDQRGIGYSEPRLDCPERQELNAWLLSGGLSWEEKDSAIVDAFRRCRERLTAEGVDLAAYRSSESAADIEDLRRVLGAEQINLYGVSYGTRLALTVIRDSPEIVRSAVLDSAYPPQVHLYTALAPSAERAFNVFFQRCAENPQCSAAYPDLKVNFYGLVDQLNAAPVTVELDAGGSRYPILLDGGLLIDVLLVGLYNPTVADTMPRMIVDVRNGEYAILRERLWLYFDDSSALGMNMAVQCSEEIPFSTPEDAFAAARGVQPLIAAFFPFSVRPLFTACREWAPGPPDPLENQPVSGNVPTLIFAGEFDPITPPEWGRETARGLSRSAFFEFPDNGHWVTRSSTCALQMALDFWRSPTIPPSSPCR